MDDSLHKATRYRSFDRDCPRCNGGNNFAVPSKSWFAILIVAFLGPLLNGCGDGLSRVSGHITLDGKPLAGGDNVAVMVMFYPESGRGAPASGLADENGDYYISTGAKTGLLPGNYIVTLSASEFIPPPDGGMPTRKDLTPSRYANPKLSGLRAEVKPGRNTFDIELTSSAGGRS